MNQDQSLREHLLYLLRGGGAHVDFESAVADFPVEKAHRRVKSLPYTAWAVLEHMRIAQWDILEFSRSAAHVSPKWPEGYWPPKDARPGAAAWNESVEHFRSDLKEVEDLVADEGTDLFAKIPHGEGQTLLREALLVADHNAYHLGVLITMKRILAEEEPAD
ncbi:MAG TPA: DinB family protein [Pyrinomonadaceae bacterium]|nr:DinB family protein [Pyrinomonadaceae bacterium]